MKEIAEHKRIKRPLGEGEEKFELFQSSVFDVIYRYDPQNDRYDFISPSVELQTGYTVEEFLSGPKEITRHITHPQDWPRVQAEVEREIAKGSSGRPFRVEYRVIRKDGKEIWVSDQKTLEFTPERKLCRINGVVRDITERRRVEEELRIEKERAERYLNIAGVMLATVNADESITLINEKGCKILGYKEGELIGRNWFDTLVPQRIRSEVRDVFRKLMAGDIEPVEYYENPLLAKNGEERLISFHNTVIRNANGQIVGVLTSGEDITERKQVEQRIRESENKFRLLFDRVFDALIMIDEEEKIRDVNQAACRLLGYTKEELLRLSVRDIHPHGEMQKLRAGVKRLSRHGIDYLGGTAFINKNGEIIEVEAGGVSLKIGNKTYIIGSFRDHTERKRAEMALHESEEKFRSLAEESPNMIFINKKGKVVYANEKCEEIMGYAREEFYSPDFDFLTLIAPEFRESVKAGFSKHEKGEEVDPLEYALIAKQGKKIDAILNTKLIRYGGETAILGIVTDITERKRAEEKLKEYTSQIEQKNLELKAKNQELTATRAQLVQKEKLRALGQMASGVAHNFNNLLAIILGRAQLLQRKAKDLDTERGLRSIERAALDASSTIRRIQGFTRVRQDQQFKWVNIDEVIEDVIALTKTKWKDQAEANDIDIRLEVQRDRRRLPPLAGDESELREAFANIIFNAVEAMPGGGKIEIKTRTDRKSISVFFADSGVGMPEEVKQKLFDPFFTTKGVRNTGLGLSVAYGIIQRHRGDIEIESRHGKGTTVIVRLPVSQTLAKGQVEEKESEKSSRPKGLAKILVIEDGLDVRELFFDILTSAGYRVKLSSTGAQGLDLCRREKFDIVFTDLGMPEMSGWEVAKAIKRMDSDAAVLLITGWGVEMDEEKLKESGISRVVTKPVKVEALLALVSEIMESKKGAKESAQTASVHFATEKEKEV